MALSEHAPKILRLFEENELAIRDLYILFSRSFPVYEDLWSGLAKEKEIHGKWIRALLSDSTGPGAAEFTGNIKPAVLQNSIRDLKGHAERFATAPTGVDRALHLAYKTETGMIESRYFQCQERDSRETKLVFSNLSESTLLHSTRLREVIKKRSRYSPLIDGGRLTPDDLDKALATARNKDIPIEAVLSGEFKIDKKALRDSYSSYFMVPVCPFDNGDSFPPDLLHAIIRNEEFYKFGVFVPVKMENGVVTIATDDPFDIKKQDLVRQVHPDKKIEFQIALETDVQKIIRGSAGSLKTTASTVARNAFLSARPDDSVPPEPAPEPGVEVSEEDSYVVKLVNAVIEEAVLKEASDIHIEGMLNSETLVRFRVDGLLKKSLTFPKIYHNAVTSRLKIMAGLDIAERRRSQSGKIQYSNPGFSEIELRMETYSTVGNLEDVVLRILTASTPLALKDLALNGRNFREFKKVTEAPYGIVLCVGPTGSGKTTTLHSALGHINKGDIKILTAEDPVEITQPGLRQHQVNPKAGMTFAMAIRSFLRADPDVIMIGEMRDPETAETAVEASLTGHLVFSTLHTNSAPETIVRLLGMGIEQYSFAEALLCVLAQRLARRLCPKCKVPMHPDEKETGILCAEYDDAARFDALESRHGNGMCKALAGGCDHCNHTGFKGRIGLHELLINTGTIKDLIYRKANAGEIRRQAVHEGMQTLLQDGIEKVLTGHTTLEEVRAVGR